jgi:hypothetical protein
MASALVVFAALTALAPAATGGLTGFLLQPGEQTGFSLHGSVHFQKTIGAFVSSFAGTDGKAESKLLEGGRLRHRRKRGTHGIAWPPG